MGGVDAEGHLDRGRYQSRTPGGAVHRSSRMGVAAPPVYVDRCESLGHRGSRRYSTRMRRSNAATRTRGKT
jgi:hypothetical protein